jgi:TPR repeat protein
MLSWMVLVGGGVTQDSAKAKAYALKAADAGRVEAMARLGDLHHNALGVERDAAAAAHWWRKAAERGHTEAQALLGAAMLMGRGIERDPVAALMWLYRARVGGSAVAPGFIAQAEAAATPEQRAEAAHLASQAGAP